jgi:hypothetical protein
VVSTLHPIPVPVPCSDHCWSADRLVISCTCTGPQRFVLIVQQVWLKGRDGLSPGLFLFGSILSKKHMSIQSGGDASEQASAPKIIVKAPISAASAAAENVKSFVAGGFGGVCAVLVGSWARHATPSPLSACLMIPHSLVAWACQVIRLT